MPEYRGFAPVSSFLAGLWKRKLLLIVVVACGALIVMGLLHPTGGTQQSPNQNSTAFPVLPSPQPTSSLPSSRAHPTQQPADPPPKPPQVSSVPARPHLYLRAPTTDLTAGTTFTANYSQSALFTPDPSYVAQDTLTDTGPGLPGPLSGLPTRPALAARRPVAVVLDNYAPDARPQAGLNRASVVFETLAEGGITRFMAIYLEADAPIVGPVRSARVYFDSWADGLGVEYAHAGGNNDALDELPYMSSIINIDGLGYLGSSFWRATDRAAPHNLYTSTNQIREAAGSVATGLAPVLVHKSPAPLAVRPKGGSIDIPFSSSEYNVHYTFSAPCDCYLRFMGGTPHVDAYSHRQIAPANVVVLFASVVSDPASDTPGSINVQTTGEGQALYFHDGAELTGTWRKASASSALRLLDARGNPAPLNPGQTWIEAAPAGSAVTWSTK
jgi:hypothetical protein